MREQIPAALDGERLDRVVALMTGVSRTRCTELVRSGQVRIDGDVVTSRSRRVRLGETVEVVGELEDAPRQPDPERGVEVPVVHADRHLIVVDKPAGVVVHPGAGNRRHTLVAGLLARFPELAEVGDPARPGLVHRLDKGTSGLLVVARTDESYHALVRQIGDRTVSRGYDALVWGHPESASGVVDAAIGRSDRDPTRMAVSTRGRAARTRYQVQATFDRPSPVSLLRCELETGRTHQIRVHLAAIGHPVVGDDRYGGRRAPLDLPRPFLHAATLTLTHPGSGERCSFASPLPAELAAVLDALA